MANLNVKGSVNITGSLTKDFNLNYGRKVDVMDQVNDTGWLEIPGSPWIGSKTIGPGGLNDFGTPDEGRSYAKFRVVNNIVYLHILNKESKNIPIWREGANNNRITTWHPARTTLAISSPQIFSRSSRLLWIRNTSVCEC